jgi:hypothetical protein
MGNNTYKSYSEAIRVMFSISPMADLMQALLPTSKGINPRCLDPSVDFLGPFPMVLDHNMGSSCHDLESGMWVPMSTMSGSYSKECVSTYGLAGRE